MSKLTLDNITAIVCPCCNEIPALYKFKDKYIIECETHDCPWEVDSEFYCVISSNELDAVGRWNAMIVGDHESIAAVYESDYYSSNKRTLSCADDTFMPSLSG